MNASLSDIWLSALGELQEAVPGRARPSEASAPTAAVTRAPALRMQTGGPYPFSAASFSCIADGMNRK